VKSAFACGNCTCVVCNIDSRLESVKNKVFSYVVSTGLAFLRYKKRAFPIDHQALPRAFSPMFTIGRLRRICPAPDLSRFSSLLSHSSFWISSRDFPGRRTTFRRAEGWCIIPKRPRAWILSRRRYFPFVTHASAFFWKGSD
jgi:hypothetical protein